MSITTEEPSGAKTIWALGLFGSGTVIVEPVPFRRRPHYYVCAPASDNEGAHLRIEIAKELKDWLNGGEEPWWLESMYRESAEVARTPHGSQIEAVGPMIDVSDPPGGLLWQRDESEDAQIQRGLLIDALMKRQRPEPQ